MKFMLISPKNRTIYNFRGDLIKDIKEKGYEVVVTGPNKENINKIEELGVKFIEVPFDKNSTGLIGNYKYYKRLKETIRNEKPDVVLSYTIKPVIFGSIAAKKSGISNIYAMITGLGQVYATNDIKTKLIRIICGIGYKKAFKVCKKVIFQNQDDKQECIERKYITDDKCEVVSGSGVNMNKFKKSSLPEKSIFLMVSRMMKTKGTLEFFKAAEIVKNKYPDTRFLYVGKTENSSAYIRMNEVQGYIDKGIVEYLGETDDVPEIVKQCSTFVLPSYYREGVPRTLLEALAMAKPIITTDNVGCRETIKNGRNGFLVPIKDYIELANKMIYMIENPNRVIEMSEASYKYCLEKFDVKIINENMMRIMEI